MNELFRTVVADPPWAFPNEANWDRPASRASAHYDTLDIKALSRLPVADVTASGKEGTALWLWTPTHHLIRGLAYELAEAWGFRPMTTLIWAKPQMGLGHYLRNAHENVLLAVRGKYKLRVKDQLSWFIAPRRRHSSKPDEFYSIVERCSHGPYLELFGRTERPGWVVWGDEIGDHFGWGFDPKAWGQQNAEGDELDD
jgi:N6-adenosine-specific RNA methylase IME4